MSTRVVTGKYPAYLMTIRTTGFRGIEKSTAMPVNLSAGRDRVIANENCKMDVMRVVYYSDLYSDVSSVM